MTSGYGCSSIGCSSTQQRSKNECSVVCFVLSAPPDSERFVESGIILFPARLVCSKSWHPPHLKSFDEHAHHTNGLLMFPTNPQAQSVRQSIGCAVACRVHGDLAAGIWQYDVGWPSCMSAGQASICAERLYTPDLQVQETRPRDSAKST